MVEEPIINASRLKGIGVPDKVAIGSCGRSVRLPIATVTCELGPAPAVGTLMFCPAMTVLGGLELCIEESAIN